MTEYVSTKQLGKEIGMDSSNTRKYVKKLGFSWLQARTPDSRNQLANVVTREDADAILEIRKSQGFSKDSQPIENGDGWFYVVQIIPEYDPLRVKLGYSGDPSHRLESYKTVSPSAKIIKVWPCKFAWERAAIDSVTRSSCKLIANEVFQCDSLETLVERCDAFFSIMPCQQ